LVRSEKDHSSRFRALGPFAQPGSKPEVINALASSLLYLNHPTFEMRGGTSSSCRPRVEVRANDSRASFASQWQVPLLSWSLPSHWLWYRDDGLVAYAFVLGDHLSAEEEAAQPRDLCVRQFDPERVPQYSDRHSLGGGRRGVDATVREGNRRATARPHSFRSLKWLQTNSSGWCS
jgi:hypothetical protein